VGRLVEDLLRPLQRDLLVQGLLVLLFREPGPAAEAGVQASQDVVAPHDQLGVDALLVARGTGLDDHPRAPFPGALDGLAVLLHGRVVIQVKLLGTLRDGREESCFTDRELVEVLAEVDVRGRLDAVGGRKDLLRWP
jgi:hypothetical protein